MRLSTSRMPVTFDLSSRKEEESGEVRRPVWPTVAAGDTGCSRRSVGEREGRRRGQTRNRQGRHGETAKYVREHQLHAGTEISFLTVNPTLLYRLARVI